MYQSRLNETISFETLWLCALRLYVKMNRARASLSKGGMKKKVRWGDLIPLPVVIFTKEKVVWVTLC